MFRCPTSNVPDVVHTGACLLSFCDAANFPNVQQLASLVLLYKDGLVISALPSSALRASAKHRGTVSGHENTFIEEDHDLLEGFHEVDVVVAVLLHLLQED